VRGQSASRSPQQRALCEEDDAPERRLIEAACEEHDPLACAILANKFVDESLNAPLGTNQTNTNRANQMRVN
jgi:hypothetical protein